MRTATGAWHLVEMQALEARIWGVPGAPVRVLDLDLTVFLAFMEGLFRRDDDNADELQRLYDAAKPKPKPTPKDREARRREIARFARMTQGEFA